ncbi:ATP-binding protein [Nocardiopsis rhodophaea]|uniref:ATP-binding protein n=1 Tax=Nocardiopsis rhodophaea TaxID=280238 RepID=UPI0031DE71E6
MTGSSPDYGCSPAPPGGIDGGEPVDLANAAQRATGGTGRDGGSGLGLSVVRSIAIARGGHADAAPRPGGGLAVTARLPLLGDDETP